MVNWISLAIPCAYLAILSGSMVVFSSIYRKRKAAKFASLEPWFPPHLQRNIYLSLLHLEQTESGKEKPIAVPDSIVKAALLRRAAEDINRIISIRSAKQALTTLLARGSVGDDLWERFQRAEKELEAELEDVVNEANALSPNWGQHIFQSANEINTNHRLRSRVSEIQSQAKSEREWWERRRETLRSEFMKELDEEAGSSTVKTPATPSTATPATPSVASSSERAASVASDEEAVLVEGGGPTTPGAQGVGKKKKKGKK